jgi:hypothetical protein
MVRNGVPVMNDAANCARAASMHSSSDTAIITGASAGWNSPLLLTTSMTAASAAEIALLDISKEPPPADMVVDGLMLLTCVVICLACELNAGIVLGMCSTLLPWPPTPSEGVVACKGVLWRSAREP